MQIFHHSWTCRETDIYKGSRQKASTCWKTWRMYYWTNLLKKSKIGKRDFRIFFFIIECLSAVYFIRAVSEINWFSKLQPYRDCRCLANSE